MSTTKYICTECHWSGSESALDTKFGQQSDEQVCPECGAFEECVPYTEATIITQDAILTACPTTQVQTYLNLGWAIVEISIDKFLNIIRK